MVNQYDPPRHPNKSERFEEYARTTPHNPEVYFNEVPQKARVERMALRCVGSVLDVGSADGFTTQIFQMAGHKVHACDISQTRIDRVRETYGIEGTVCDGATLPFEDGQFDTVVLGEVLEHVENPGLLFSEAARVAKERVVISVPLNGWADPTHLWRISIDVVGQRNPNEPTKGEQAVITWQKGVCWPQDYFIRDRRWWEQFWIEPTSEFHIMTTSADE